MPTYKVPALKPGDLIRICAPCSPFDKNEFEKGVRLLESWGLRVKYSRTIFDRKPYLAGSDRRRFKELKSAFEDKDAKAILFARGGYGMMRIIEDVSKLKIKPPAKLIIGYSDLTPLLQHITNTLKWPCFYGPVIAKDLSSKTPKPMLDSFKHTLFGTQEQTIKFSNPKILKPGFTKAKITGGCLTLLASTMGTPFEIKTKNTILFIEDVNEKPYEIDRMLQQLALAGKLKELRGLIIGSMAGPNPKPHYEETIKSFLSDIKGPVIWDETFGHGTIKRTLPLGVKVELSTKTKSLKIIEWPFLS